ncbi:TrkH-domain-containing protein [Serendipita vermifera]|nr:TrkH-domain-containing protein [Serendipita vermifera]
MEKSTTKELNGQGETIDVNAGQIVDVQFQDSRGPKRWLRKHLNFFRIYLLSFTFFPLFFSIIFWAVNGRYKIGYMDALAICYSAFTNTGLAPFDLSRTTPLQQAILYVQMFLGSPIVVSWIVVLVRKHTLAYQCSKWMQEKRIFSRSTRSILASTLPSFLSKTLTEPDSSMSKTEQGQKSTPPRSSTGNIKAFRRETIRRVDTELKRVDPSGRISREPSVQQLPPEIFFEPMGESIGSEENVKEAPPVLVESPRSVPAVLEDGSRSILSEDPTAQEAWKDLASDVSPPVGDILVSSPSAEPSAPLDTQVRSPRVVDFNVPNPTNATNNSGQNRNNNIRRRRIATTPPERKKTWSEIDIRQKNGPKNGPRRRSTSYHIPHVDERFVTKNSIGLGGFPGPMALVRRLWRFLAAKFEGRAAGRVFKSYPSKLLPLGQAEPGQLARYDTKEVPYFSFSAVVGKNSAFYGLTEEELEELGGVEYRALKMLSYIVPCYYVFIQALGWAVDASLFSKDKYQTLFAGQWRYVRPSWAGVFMGTSAVTNTGMSLVDTALIPFQAELGVLIITSFQTLAGNTAFPVFLRLVIWIGTKITSGRAWATLHFLLDHPRRCFLYLFPSHQTWFLLIVIFLLNMIDWAGFMLFDLDNPALEPIPINLRVLNGLLQATSVRCAGVASVSIAYLAPATQVLFLIMMYIAPYPIAMAVRSTNVYEDRSLGVYEEEEDSDEEEEMEEAYARDKRSRPVVWGSYLAWHAKRQLAYDIWWVAGAWLLVSIFERGKIWNPSTKQFDLFGILFELVSAYSSVGLSIGLSTANYSLSGAWSTASKIVLCIVMIRGRSRGLPVAIDRAVMMPPNFSKLFGGGSNNNNSNPKPNGGEEKQRLETIPEKEAT